MKKIFTTLFLLLFITNLFSQIDSLDNEFSSQIIKLYTNTKGGAGSFGKRLSSQTSFVSLNGYATTEYLLAENTKNTFDNRYFNLLASAEVSKHIFAEIQMEYEHSGTKVYSRYTQVDYKFNDFFIIRSGKFLVPAGEFNEYLYPEYISNSISRAFVNMEVIPVSWSETGVQLRGQLKLNGDSSLIIPYYSVYVVNGLEGADGASLRIMRDNAVDTTAGNKAIGGNLGTDIGHNFNFAINYYKGHYSTTGELDLKIYGASINFDNNKFSFYGEFHLANQEVYNNNFGNDYEREIQKYGFYAQLAYQYKKIQPVIRYDQIRFNGLETNDPNKDLLQKDRVTFGLNFRFHENCVFKTNYEIIKNQGIDVKDNLFSLQLSIGF